MASSLSRMYGAGVCLLMQASFIALPAIYILGDVTQIVAKDYRPDILHLSSSLKLFEEE